MSELTLARRPIPDADDLLRRYCGLPWSGSEPEVWAYSYYDTLHDQDPHDVGPIDVLAAAALHPNFTRADLEWFARHRKTLQDLLAQLPNIDLADADTAVLNTLPTLAGSGVELSLLSKVLHRKRPKLIPLLDRTLTGWYRRQLSTQGAAAWAELVHALAEDLRGNADELAPLRSIAPLTDLRIADIVIWMNEHTIEAHRPGTTSG